MISGRIIIDVRSKTKKGYPLKIRVTKDRLTRHIHLHKYSQQSKIEEVDRKLSFFINKRNLHLIDEIEYCNENKLNFEESIEILKNGINDEETDVFILEQKLKKLKPKAKVGLIEFFDIRISEKKKTNEATKAYEDIRKMLFIYNGEVDVNMNDVTYEWLNAFVIHKMQSASRSGVNSYLASIRAVYKESQRRSSLKVKQDNPFLGLFKPSVKKEKNIPKDDIFKKLITYKGGKYQPKKSKRFTEIKIKLSLFQYLIGGHYLVDVSLLKWSDYRNGRLIFKRYKNRNKPDGGVIVNVKVFKQAKDIIDELGTKDNERIFSFIPHKIKEPTRYKYYVDNFNRTFRIILENLEMTDYDYSSRTPRYIFRTKAGNLQINDLTVMQIQGHKPQGITYSYQGRLSNKILDKKHKKILKGVVSEIKSLKL